MPETTSCLQSASGNVALLYCNTDSLQHFNTNSLRPCQHAHDPVATIVPVTCDVYAEAAGDYIHVNTSPTYFVTDLHQLLPTGCQTQHAEFAGLFVPVGFSQAQLHETSWPGASF